MMKMRKMDLDEIHPSKVFGKKWVDYVDEIRKTANEDEFLGVLHRISENHNVTMGDTAIIFSKVLFSNETFYKILVKRDATILQSVFELLQTHKQE